jgi:hypothetical protein
MGHKYMHEFSFKLYVHQKSWKNRVIERINSRYSDELDKVITSCLSLSPDRCVIGIENLQNDLACGG